MGNFAVVWEFTYSHTIIEEIGKHSETMQLAIFKHVDGMSWGELWFALFTTSVKNLFLFITERIEVCRLAVELPRNLPAVFCFHNFVIIWTCTYSHFSISLHKGEAAKSDCIVLPF